MSFPRSAAQLGLLLCTAFAGTQADAQSAVRPGSENGYQAGSAACGPMRVNVDGAGPYDFRIDKNRLRVVENAHFTPGVEQLFERKTGYFGADIGFTLFHFPNHHRALDAMTRLSKRERVDKPRGATYSIECYFERALRFRNDDVVARMLYAEYLVQAGRADDALEQLRVCRNLAGDNAMTHYNVGMIYADAKRNDLALAEAHKAMALGLQWPGLKDRLVKVGAWSEAVAIPVAPAAAGASEPSAIAAMPAPAASAP